MPSFCCPHLPPVLGLQLFGVPAASVPGGGHGRSPRRVLGVFLNNVGALATGF